MKAVTCFEFPFFLFGLNLRISLENVNFCVTVISFLNSKHSANSTARALSVRWRKFQKESSLCLCDVSPIPCRYHRTFSNTICASCSIHSRTSTERKKKKKKKESACVESREIVQTIPLHFLRGCGGRDGRSNEIKFKYNQIKFKF